MKDGIYAAIHTQKGTITLQLHYEKTPATVGNFIGLAEGSLANEVKQIGIPFYDGLNFHRVIPDFMVQGGCPQGSGVGGPGYKFDDEIDTSLRHDKAGILSMANAGPGTNGSQFFITHVPTPWLDGKHTVFGCVIEGQQIVDSITQGDKIDKIEIHRIGKDTQDWDAVTAFNSHIQRHKNASKLKKLSKRKKSIKKVWAFSKRIAACAIKLYKRVLGNKWLMAKRFQYIIKDNSLMEQCLTLRTNANNPLTLSWARVR